MDMDKDYFRIPAPFRIMAVFTNATKPLSVHDVSQESGLDEDTAGNVMRDQLLRDGFLIHANYDKKDSVQRYEATIKAREMMANVLKNLRLQKVPGLELP